MDCHSRFAIKKVSESFSFFPLDAFHAMEGEVERSLGLSLAKRERCIFFTGEGEMRLGVEVVGVAETFFTQDSGLDIEDFSPQKAYRALFDPLSFASLSQVFKCEKERRGQLPWLAESDWRLGLNDQGQFFIDHFVKTIYLTDCIFLKKLI